MNLEKLTEKEKVEKLGYASYEAFNKINSLLINTLTDMCEKEKKSGTPADPYVCSSLEHIALLLLSIKGRYERNNIKFEEKDVFSCKDIEQMFTGNKDEKEQRNLKKTIKEVYNFGITGIQLDKLISTATSKIIQGIETSLSKIPKYDPKHNSKELHKSIGQNLKEVKEYAKIGAQLGDILIDLKMGRKGYLVKAEMEKLADTKGLMKKIKDEHMDKVLRPVIDMHAGMYNLPFDGNSDSFLGEPGEKIDWLMILAKGVKETKAVITESQVAGRRKFLGATTDGEMYIHRYADDVNKTVRKNGLAPALAEYIRKDKDFEELTQKVNAPFEDLEDKLNSLGAGYELAKKVSQYLSTEMLCRGLTPFKTVEQKDVYKTLAKKIDTEDEDSISRYAIAMKRLIEKLSGKKIHDFALSYFEKGQTHSSNAISGWMIATKKRRNGKSKIVYENMKRRELKDLLDTAKKQFTKKENDILVTENTGVCFTFDFLLGAITSNFRSLIEVQNAFEEMSKADELSGLIYKTAVMAHETTHASQINSRLIWRSIAVSIAAYAAEMTLKWKKEGRLDYESPESINCFEKQTNRFEMIRLIDEISAQALGVGEKAESYRRKGIYDGIIAKGARLRKDGRFNNEYFTQIELEDSKSARLVKRIKEAIEKDDIKLLRRLKTEAEEYGKEISSMIETMAETFGIKATEEFITNYPGKLSEKEKQEYIEALKTGIIIQGVRGEKFTKIASKYKEYSPKMEKELNKEGLTYKRILTKYDDLKPVEDLLINLGYDPLNPIQAYEDMQGLEKRIAKHNKTAEKKLGLKDAYYPLNSGKVQVDIRYRKNIPMYMKVVEKYGTQKAHELMLNAESLKDIEGLVKE